MFYRSGTDLYYGSVSPKLGILLRIPRLPVRGFGLVADSLASTSFNFSFSFLSAVS